MKQILKWVLIVAVLSFIAYLFYANWLDYYHQEYRMWVQTHNWYDYQLYKAHIAGIPKDDCLDVRPANGGGVIMSLKDGCSEGFMYPFGK